MMIIVFRVAKDGATHSLVSKRIIVRICHVDDFVCFDLASESI